ncbi:CoxG family protein [Cytobacillus gottheilii]|uniref:SRPBCC family protein n=1 Tax=Cytobacillus gottheilii TaxID=859144 RepID=A0ABX8F645_9BACI|nr:SRPBCC family protein [Cytobacillus gottheilii]QVY59819.1 SRPBCC family protein [Cytobacillus gottheilii]
MPNYSHTVEVDLPIQQLWNFVHVMDNWAPLVPGYISHRKVNDNQSLWSFYTDIGVMKKKIELQVDITEWSEPHKVAFQLTGINEKLSGSGYFSAQVSEGKKVEMTGFLDLTAEGMMAKMANSIMKSSLPEITKELTEAVAEKAEQPLAPIQRN